MNEQLEKNRAAYEKLKEKLEAEQTGQVALLHDGELVGVYPDSGEAYSIGRERFGLGEFYTKKIGEAPISLGIFTLCIPGTV